MATPRPHRLTSVQAQDVEEGMTLSTSGGHHRTVVEVDHTSNVAGQVIIRTAVRPGARPTGSTVCRPHTPLYAVEYLDSPSRAARRATAQQDAAAQRRTTRAQAHLPGAAAPGAPGFHAATQRTADGEYQVRLRATGQTIGHVRRTTPAHATLTARWEALDTTGSRVASGCLSRADAITRLLRATQED